MSLVKGLRGTLVLSLLIYSGTAGARVFAFGEEGFAPYVGGQYLTFSSGADGGYASSGGAGNAFASKYSTGMGYEFGFTYGIQKVRLLFGFEYIKPAVLTAVTGTNAAGAVMYAMENDLSAMVPKVGFEVDLKTWKEARFYMDAQYGSASVTMASTYTFTTAGTAAYPTMTNFKEEIKGTASMIQGGFGFEFLGFDSTTIQMGLGYRSLKVSALTHNLAVTSFQGAVAKGAPAMNDDGTARSLDLSGYYVSVMFRFWLM